MVSQEATIYIYERKEGDIKKVVGKNYSATFRGKNKLSTHAENFEGKYRGDFSKKNLNIRY